MIDRARGKHIWSKLGGLKAEDLEEVDMSDPEVDMLVDEDVNKVIDDLYSRWKARQSSAVSLQPSDKTQSSGSGGSINFQGGNEIASSPSTSSSTLLTAGAQAPRNDETSQPNGQTSGPDDNFAIAMGAANLADLRVKIRKDLEDHSKLNGELDFEEAILQEVEKITSVELPDILIEDELNRMLVSLQRRVADMGLLLDDYLRGQGKTLDQLKNEWRVQAEKNVRMELGLSEIARAENVNITDTDLQAEIDKIQDEKVKRQFESQEPRLHLKHALRQTKTLNLLKTLVATS